MLPDRYLIAGLDAMACIYPPGSDSQKGFVMGHFAAALLSGKLLGPGRPVGRRCGTGDGIPSSTRRGWGWDAMTPQTTQEAPSPGELERFLAALQESFGTSEYSGHHVIFSSLALRVLRQLPQLTTPRRMAGLLHMAKAFPALQPRAPAVPAPLPHQPAGFCNEVLDAFLASLASRHGPGYSGHLLTFGCAVLDLYDLGYTELARSAEIGYRDYMTACRHPASDPSEPGPSPAHATHPESAAFWRSRPDGYVMASIGHHVKYSYAFLTLEAKASDSGLLKEARLSLHRIIP